MLIFEKSSRRIRLQLYGTCDEDIIPTHNGAEADGGWGIFKIF